MFQFQSLIHQGKIASLFERCRAKIMSIEFQSLIHQGKIARPERPHRNLSVWPGFQSLIHQGKIARQQGGTQCMQHLLVLVSQLVNEKGLSLPPLPYWWDGIGNWRRPSLKETFAKNRQI